MKHTHPKIHPSLTRGKNLSVVFYRGEWLYVVERRSPSGAWIPIESLEGCDRRRFACENIEAWWKESEKTNRDEVLALAISNDWRDWLEGKWKGEKK